MIPISLGKRLDYPGNLVWHMKMGGHILIAGLTGFGKTNEVNLILYQAASHRQVQMVLCNASGKTDYLNWLPRASSVALGVEATDAVVDACIEIMERRYRDLIPAGASHNMTPGLARQIALEGVRKVEITDDVPLILLVIDEFVQYLAGRKGPQRIAKLTKLVTISRAAGMVLVLATQRPSHDLVTTNIRENIPYKVSFALDKGGAGMVFGNLAENIPLDELTIPGQGYAMIDGERESLMFLAPEVNETASARKAIQTEHLRVPPKELADYWYVDSNLDSR
jgi:S-DNA-T family DNA segregation ATPase FtsK/SpoIIIE